MPLLAERKIGSYLERLASREPTPGGGGACALTAAQGAALLAMSVAVSGVERWHGDQDGGDKLLESLTEARLRFVALGDRDEEVFGRLMQAYRLPKGDAAAVDARTKALQAATSEAAQVPLAVMRLAASLLESADVIVTRAKPSIVSDAAIAVRLLDAALRASTATVAVNLAAMPDAAAAHVLQEDVAALLAGKDQLVARLLAEAERVMKS